MDWHTMPVEEVFNSLKTSDQGITQKEAQARLNTYGFNELKEKKENNAANDAPTPIYRFYDTGIDSSGFAFRVFR